MNGIYLKRIIPPTPDPYAPIDGNTFTWDGFEYKVIVKDGLAWLDRNLGASRAATASNDSDAYGDLYQWGRLTDGHEKRATENIFITTQSTTDNPNTDKWIGNATDWRNPKNDNLWQGVDGINNPAPTGWRLPTNDEMVVEKATWATQNEAGGFGSVLKWTAAGFFSPTNKGLAFDGMIGLYWNSTVNGDKSRVLRTDSNNESWERSYGFSVRVVRDLP